MKKTISSASSEPQFTFGKLPFTSGSHGYDEPDSWLIDDFIPTDSFGVIYGPSSTRKSFIAIDISCAIATHSQWHSNDTLAGAVMYVAAEGQKGISRRVKAWECATGKNAEHVYKLGKSAFVSKQSVRDDILEAVHDLECSRGVKVKLIVLDTLARNFEGDENNPDAMGKFIRGCDQLKEATNASILVVHHSGKDVSKGSRGSSTLHCACDYEFNVVYDKKNNFVTLRNTKQKDAPEAPDMVFNFQPVELDIFNKKGEPISSLASLTPATIKYNKSNTGYDNNPILNALRDTFGGSCTREELRTHCFPQKEGVAANTTTQKFKRALTALIEQNLVSVQQKGATANRNDIITAIEL
ncbi:helicase RepA family protein [Photobacterium leiognathi]|uniref:helicase RepA family protein n=1 Tax=Photobacterium leiognathi TaxID=553611 RepID=UPI002739DCD7|nr:helicase RepA family protein [Photobacterium leiognathi]